MRSRRVIIQSPIISIIENELRRRVQGGRGIKESGQMIRNKEGLETVQEVFADLRERHLNPRSLESLPTGRQV
jgi:hypothetical protein